MQRKNSPHAKGNHMFPVLCMQALGRNSIVQNVQNMQNVKTQVWQIKVAHASSQLKQISTNNAQKIQRAYQARQTNPGDTGGAPLRATHR